MFLVYVKNKDIYFWNHPFEYTFNTPLKVQRQYCVGGDHNVTAVVCLLGGSVNLEVVTVNERTIGGTRGRGVQGVRSHPLY